MVLRSILSTWLSLGPSIFQTVIDMCPSPVKAVSRVRAMYMFFGESATSLVDGPALPSNLSDESVAGAPGDEDLAISPAIDALQQCSSEAEAPVLIFVSKVFWTDRQKSLHSSQPPAPWPSDSTSTSVPTPSAKSPSTEEGSRSRAFALFSRPPTMPENPFVTTEFVALSRIYSGRVYIGQRLFVLGPKFDGSKVPEYLLDADASNFPLGPLHLSDADDFSSHDARSIFGTSPSSSSVSSALSRSLSGGSMDSNIRRVLRHVYVAEICDVVQFAGGQNNVTRLSDPNCPVKYLPAGNVVGLIGPSLIASLPKSGLLVSRLRLVASPEESTTDADMELLGEVRRGGPSGRRVLPLAGLAVWHGAPVVSLAVEPASATNPDDLTKLEQGLRLLERSDPCAEVTISPKGEYLLHAAGEVHMQKCLEDLTKYFAPDVEIHTSQFVVPFRETVTRGCPPTAYVPFDSYAYAQMQLDLELKRLNLIYDPEHEHCVRRMTAEERSQAAIAAAATTSAVGLCDQRQQSEADSMRQQQLLLHRKQEEPQGDWVKWMPLGMLQLPHCKSKTRLFIRVTAHPIPPRLLTWLETRATIYVPQLLRSLRHKSWRTATYIKKFESEFAAVLDSLSNTQDGDDALKTTAPAEVDYMNWATLKNQLVCFGPGQVGPNVLFSRLRSRLFRLNTAWGKPVPAWVDDTSACSSEDATTTTTTASHISFLSYGKTILRGFQMATEQGPLCGEPMRGVAFILEDIYAEDRHKLPTPTVLQGPSALVTVDSVTTGSEAAPLTEAQERKDDRKAEKSDVKEVEIQVTKKAEEDDPILMALRAKQAAAQMRQKSRRLGSLSWLDPDDGDETDEEDWDFDEDFEDDYGDGDGGKSGSSDSDGSDSAAEEDVQSVAPEKKIRLPELFYWKRRNDCEWLSDVTPGLLTPTMARACIAAFQACPGQRLVLSMYDVELQSRSDVLGRMYSVLRKHYGRIIGEDLREGEECFVIRARLPVIESFGLTSDLRKRTSGVVALPQLRPGGWEVLDIDPLQRDASGRVAVGEAHFKIFQYQQDVLRRQRLRPGKRMTVRGTTADESASSESEQDEELLLDEVNAQLTRLRNYIRSVRQRKGLCLNEQLVVSADKQRTLKKNK
uniref:Elongation factor EFG domain-containing protein n=1 Tax=Schistocephalus solidus TaxID=70667 RepID=A0A0V0J896_SCHSO